MGPRLESAAGEIGVCVITHDSRRAYAAADGGLNSLMRHVASRWGAKALHAIASRRASRFTLTPEINGSSFLTRELLDGMMANIPGRRLGRPEDIAGVVAMLLPGDRRWINGQVFNVNGGALMR